VDSSEQRLEHGNEVSDDAGQLIKSWNDRLTLNNLRLTERYSKGELRLLIYIRVPMSGQHPIDLCAVLQGERALREGWARGFNSIEHRLPDVREHASEIQDHISMSDPHSKQQSMFVDVVKFVDEPESVIPTTVRIQTVDFIHGHLAHALYFSRVKEFVFRGVLSDGKRSPSGWSAAVCEDQLIGQVVQRASQVVNNISDDGSPAERNLGVDPNVKYQVSGLRVFLSENGVGASFLKDSDPGIQIMDVLFGPFDLDPNMVDRLSQELSAIPETLS
jgi:hypothetical protein